MRRNDMTEQEEKLRALLQDKRITSLLREKLEAQLKVMTSER